MRIGLSLSAPFMNFQLMLTNTQKVRNVLSMQIIMAKTILGACFGFSGQENGSWWKCRQINSVNNTTHITLQFAIVCQRKQLLFIYRKVFNLLRLITRRHQTKIK